MSLQSLTKFASVALLSAALFGCRGSESKKPPIHLNPNMDLQDKYKAQEESTFFVDGSTMRPAIEGTIPLSDNNGQHGEDFLKHDSAFYEGKNADGTFVKNYPSLEKLGFSDVKALLKRGQQRYDIYCAPCHSKTGDGQGAVAQRGFPGVLNLTTYAGEAGKAYNAIYKGGPIMPSYAYQIKVRDRWAIVAYLEILKSAAQDAQYKSILESQKKK
ncbi:MAG: cytochrome c [Lentisphaeraceae bacterium]|nr:cytochrome c [Lentisphaeraceae bacterium]